MPNVDRGAIQTLIPCMECGRGFPFREMHGRYDGDGMIVGYVCPTGHVLPDPEQVIAWEDDGGQCD